MRNMIIATDLSRYALNAVKVGLSWAQEFKINPIIVYVDKQPAETIPSILCDKVSGIDQLSNSTLEDDIIASIHSHLGTLANYYKFEIEVWAGDCASAIIQSANNHNAELIVVGLRGHNYFREILLGSVAQRVFEQSPVSVLGVHESLNSLPERPLLCTEYLELGGQKVNVARALCQSGQIKHLNILHIINPETVMELKKDNEDLNINSLEDALNKASKHASKKINEFAHYFKCETKTSVITCQLIKPGEQILEYIDTNKNDLIFIGSHSHNSLRKWVMGSTSEYLLRRAETSLFVSK